MIPLASRSNRTQRSRRRWSARALETATAIAIAVSLAAAGPVGAVPVEDRVYHFNIGPDGQPLLQSADPDGDRQSTVGSGFCGNLPAVSPDGQAIAYDSCSGGLRVVNTDGTGDHEVLANQHDDAYWRFAQFTPDGQSLIVNRLDQDTWEDDIYLLARSSAPAGPALSPLIGWPGDQYQAQFTPDGEEVIFISNWDPDEGYLPGYEDQKYSFYVMDRYSGNVRRVRSADGLYDPWWIRISPDGQTLAFDAQTDPGSDDDVYTMDIDGGNLTRLTAGAENEGTAAWAVDGQRVFFATDLGLHSMARNGADARLIVNGGYQPAVRQPSSILGEDDIRALRFRPVLRFDTSERWRPLNIDAFFGEARHTLCDAQGCEAQPMNSPEDLGLRNSFSAFIDIAGEFEQAGDEENYASADPNCLDGGLRDCDTGSSSAGYYRRAPGTPGGYKYIDYWFFYRANYFLGAVGFHEGDWEAVTVAPAASGETFDYAAFSQHGQFFAYLRDVLRCEDSPAPTVPAAGTCGPASKRISTMVANGSHANYTTPCSETITAVSCSSNGGVGRERGYDGANRWGRAFDDPGTTVFRMPPTLQGKWIDWAGRWGVPLGGVSAGGPLSPGVQPVEIQCARIDNDPVNCDPGPRASSAGLSARVLPSGSSPGLTAKSCESWIGAGIGATVCEPRRLRRAVLGRKLGDKGDVKIYGTRRRGLNDSAPGVAQLATARPLHDGSRLRIRGRLSRSTRVLVRALDRSRKS